MENIEEPMTEISEEDAKQYERITELFKAILEIPSPDDNVATVMEAMGRAFRMIAFSIPLEGRVEVVQYLSALIQRIEDMSKDVKNEV